MIFHRQSLFHNWNTLDHSRRCSSSARCPWNSTISSNFQLNTFVYNGIQPALSGTAANLYIEQLHSRFDYYSTKPSEEVFYIYQSHLSGMSDSCFKKVHCQVIWGPAMVLKFTFPHSNCRISRAVDRRLKWSFSLVCHIKLTSFGE